MNSGANRESLLARLTILDFMALDLHLYLVTHPNDSDTIEKYNNIVMEADDIRYKYEKECGPLCSYRSMSSEPFKWIDNPWPWNRDFNYKISKGDF